MTQFKDYCKDNGFDPNGNFILRDQEDGLIRGDIVKLEDDDNSDCPSFRIVATNGDHMSNGDVMYVYYENLYQELVKVEADPSWRLETANTYREAALESVKKYNEYLASRPKDDHAPLVLR